MMPSYDKIGKKGSKLSKEGSHHAAKKIGNFSTAISAPAIVEGTCIVPETQDACRRWIQAAQ